MVQDQGPVHQPGEGVMEGGVVARFGDDQLSADHCHHVCNGCGEGDFVIVADATKIQNP